MDDAQTLSYRQGAKSGPTRSLNTADGDFLASMGGDRATDPWPDFATLRQECPVVAGRGLRFGPIEMPDFWLLDGSRPSYLVVGHEAAERVFRDSGSFSSQAYLQTVGQTLGRSLVMMDEPEHRRFRALVAPVFARSAIERWKFELAVPTADRLIGDLLSLGRAELLGQLVRPFLVEVVHDLLGLPRADRAYFGELAASLANVAIDRERAISASNEIAAYLTPLIVERRTRPAGDDLTGVLVHAEVDGEQLTDDEILAFLRNLLAAGNSPGLAFGNLLFALLTHPEQLGAVRADRGLVSQAVEEGLRWESVGQFNPRMAVKDAQVAGVDIPAGSWVYVCGGAADRDERRWDHPEDFDIFRPYQSNLAFGSGAHMCVGINFAKMEIGVLLDAVLDRLVDLRLDPDAPVHIRGVGARGLSALPVVFEPRPAQG
jgi:cytochrome P450